MSAISVYHCRRDFQRSVQNSLSFAQDTKNLARLTITGIKQRHIRDKETIYAIFLLKIYLYWEDLVENTFLRYMCGATSHGGYGPILLQPRERNISSARSTLYGSSRYLNWQKQNILNRANRYFQGGLPFTTAIAAVSTTLDDIISVRNRIAHRSEFSRREFRNVVVGALGYVPQGYTPGRFLMANLANGGTQTFLETYGGALLGAGGVIVP